MSMQPCEPAVGARGPRMRALAIVAICCAHAPALFAQDARVYVADPAKNRLLKLAFDPPSATTVNSDESTRTSLRALALREDGVGGAHVIACDPPTGEVLFYSDAAGAGVVIFDATDGGPTHAAGPSLDAAGNLLLVSPGTKARTAQVWAALRDLGDSGSSGFAAFPGGYRAPLGRVDGLVEAVTPIGGVDTTIPAEELEECFRVRTAAGALAAGDVLVVSSVPPMLLRYRAADVRAFLDALRAMAPGDAPPAEINPDTLVHPPHSSVPVERRFPDTATPGGVAMAPDGSLLVPVRGGRILIFEPDGTRRSDGAGGFVDFASGLGRGKCKVAVGPQGGRHRAFVSDRARGEVLRFTILADGTGALDGSVTAGVDLPMGIATTTSSIVETPQGDDVALQQNVVLESRVDHVLVGGVTSSQVILFADPREKEVDTPPEMALHRSLLLSEISEDLPDVEIPPYVRSFRLGDPDRGVPTFILVLADTTAGLDGLVTHLSDEAAILGYEPDCHAPEPWRQPRLFWAPTPDEPPIVEEPRFIDITDACGSNRGLSRNTLSVFLPGSRDTRPLVEVARFKFDGLGALLARSDCIEAGVYKKLDRKLASAFKAFKRGRDQESIVHLTDFAGIVAANPAAFGGCPPERASEFRSRAGSAIFSIALMQ